MHNTVERRRNPANLPALPTLRDNMSAAGHGRFPFLERLSDETGRLRQWLAHARQSHRDDFEYPALDDKVLDDIGLSRIDMLYKQPD
jgi:uncharacterized protein YjiS (DUF1127 family)